MREHNSSESAAEFAQEHGPWPVSFNEKGRVVGLPAGVSEKNVLVYIGGDGSWYAQNPPEELLKEIRQWHSGWV